MRAVGIVAEYNPFHQGHGWHIRETRRLAEDRAVVCVMSGNYVQRGVCAVADKWTRAGLALEHGADLVLELPTPWAISSAEGFARGAVEVLRATGVVDSISFGSESGDLEGLRRVAACLEGEDYRAALRSELDKGSSFARSRRQAVVDCIGLQGKLLDSPNDSLAVEYLRASGGLRPIAVRRVGSGHDSRETGDGFASASAVRELIERGDWEEVDALLCPGDGPRLRKAGVARMANGERAVLSRLRGMGEADFAALPDSGAAEGLPDRLVRAARQAVSLEEFYALAKTKRYAHARLRRLALWAFLGLTAADRTGPCPPYLRVLGLNGRGKALLREMKETAVLPVVVKPAKAGDLLERESRLTDQYGLFLDKIRPCGMEYTTGPAIR